MRINTADIRLMLDNVFAIPDNGPISINDVANALGRPIDLEFNMNHPDFRAVAERLTPDSQVTLGDCLGKTLPINLTLVPDGNITILPGDDLTLTTDGTGLEPITITWFKDSVEILSGISRTYEVIDADTFDAGVYQAHWQNILGVGLTSTLNLTIATADTPIFLTQPTSQTALEGALAEFTVLAEPVTSYQWEVDSGSGYGDISGATNPTYSIATTDRVENGNLYRCVATNTVGTTVLSATSLSASLNVQYIPDVPTAPTLSPNPVDDEATVVFTTTNVDSGNPAADTYEWYLAGSLEATTSTLTYSHIASLEDDGDVVTVTATNSIGSATSVPSVQLDVTNTDYVPGKCTAITFSSDPASEGATVTLTTTLADLGKPAATSYEWFRASTLFATTATLETSIIVAKTDNGIAYTVRAVSAFGSGAVSDGSILEVYWVAVVNPPTYSPNPVTEDDQVQLLTSIQTHGSPEVYTYRWLIDNVDITGEIPTPDVLVNAELVWDTKQLTAIATNAAGASAPSVGVVMNVDEIPDTITLTRDIYGNRESGDYDRATAHATGYLWLDTISNTLYFGWREAGDESTGYTPIPTPSAANSIAVFNGKDASLYEYALVEAPFVITSRDPINQTTLVIDTWQPVPIDGNIPTLFVETYASINSDDFNSKTVSGYVSSVWHVRKIGRTNIEFVINSKVEVRAKSES